MFTTIHAQNPNYEEIKLEFEVAFHAGLEFGYQKKQLNEDLLKYLNPWAYEEGKDIRFGGRIHKSVLINFIDGLEYVDFISNFHLFHIDKNNTKSHKKEIVEASSAKAILVSAKRTFYSTDQCIINLLMKTTTTISKQQPAQKVEDYEFLRKEGLRYIEQFASDLWTDYNSHDPGMTILDIICYAITDLGNRTSYSMPRFVGIQNE